MYPPNPEDILFDDSDIDANGIYEILNLLTHVISKLKERFIPESAEIEGSKEVEDNCYKSSSVHNINNSDSEESLQDEEADNSKCNASFECSDNNIFQCNDHIYAQKENDVEFKEDNAILTVNVPNELNSTIFGENFTKPKNNGRIEGTAALKVPNRRPCSNPFSPRFYIDNFKPRKRCDRSQSTFDFSRLEDSKRKLVQKSIIYKPLSYHSLRENILLLRRINFGNNSFPDDERALFRIVHQNLCNPKMELNCTNDERCFSSQENDFQKNENPENQEMQMCNFPKRLFFENMYRPYLEQTLVRNVQRNLTNPLQSEALFHSLRHFDGVRLNSINEDSNGEIKSHHNNFSGDHQNSSQEPRKISRHCFQRGGSGKRPKSQSIFTKGVPLRARPNVASSDSDDSSGRRRRSWSLR